MHGASSRAALGLDAHRPERAALARVLLLLLVYVVVEWLALRTGAPGNALHLVWPAAGVALLWAATGSAETWPLDATLFLVATLLVAVTAGTSTRTAVAIGLGSTVTVGIALLLLRRLTPDLWGAGGRRPMSALGDLGRFAGAVGVGALAGATVAGLLGAGLTGPDALVRLVALGIGSAAGMVAVGCVGQLVGAGLVAGGFSAPSRPAASYAALAGVSLVAAVVCWLAFVHSPPLPGTFLLALVMVWTGARHAALTAALLGLAVGSFAVVRTLTGSGAFAAVRSEPAQPLVAQLFVVALVVTGLAVAFSRSERNAVIRQLELAELSTTQRATELSLLLENLTEGVAVLDEDDYVLIQNPAVRRILRREGPARGRLHPLSDDDVTLPDGTPVTAANAPYARAFRGERVVAQLLHLRRPGSAEVRVVEMGARLLPAQRHTERPRVVVTLRDVTEEQRRRDSLASFAGVVAHDLSSPLTVIDGWTEALLDEFATRPAVTEGVGAPMVQRIRGAATHMRDFIADLLADTLSREAVLHPAKLSLDDVVADVVALRLSPLPGDDPALRPRIDAGGLPDAWGDPVLVRQLLDNLLSNAVKYVAPGVVPHVRVTATPLDESWVQVSVTDNGIGIPADERAQVFDAFHRLNRSTYGGTGLGLAICRRIVERHGGSIGVHGNATGPGCTFTFTLPRTEAALTALHTSGSLDSGTPTRPI